MEQSSLLFFFFLLFFSCNGINPKRKIFETRTRNLSCKLQTHFKLIRMLEVSLFIFCFYFHDCWRFLYVCCMRQTHNQAKQVFCYWRIFNRAFDRIKALELIITFVRFSLRLVVLYFFFISFCFWPEEFIRGTWCLLLKWVLLVSYFI